MSRVIEPRYGAEVYISESNHICILQKGPGENALVVLHPEEALHVADVLKATYQELIERGPESVLE